MNFIFSCNDGYEQSYKTAVEFNKKMKEIKDGFLKLFVLMQLN